MGICDSSCLSLPAAGCQGSSEEPGPLRLQAGSLGPKGSTDPSCHCSIFCSCCSVTKSCLRPREQQAALAFTISQSLLKLTSIESVIPSNHLILGHPFSSCLQSSPASGSLPMSWLFASSGQVLELQFQHQFHEQTLNIKRLAIKSWSHNSFRTCSGS